MKRTLLDDLLRDVERITGERDLVMIGSQAIHAVATVIPAEVSFRDHFELETPMAAPGARAKLMLDPPRVADSSRARSSACDGAGSRARSCHRPARGRRASPPPPEQQDRQDQAETETACRAPVPGRAAPSG